MSRPTDVGSMRLHRWFTQPKAEAGPRAFAEMRELRRRQGYRKALDLHHARLYGDTAMRGFGAGSYARFEARPGARLALNIVANCADALHAQITSNRVRPFFATDRAKWEYQQRAKGLQQAVEASFYRASVHETMAVAFTDATVFGTGPLKHFIERDVDGKAVGVVTERTLVDELVVDDREAIYGAPRTLWQWKYVSRDLLEKRYAKVDVGGSASFDEDDMLADGATDLVVVVEAWHLPSARGAKDGRHIITTEKATLVDEKYTAQVFPFTFLKLKDPLRGFWGVGIAQALTGLQFEINKLLREIQTALHLLGKSHWMVADDSNVVLAHLNNDMATMIRYASTSAPPQVYTPQVVPPEVYSHLWNLYREAYQIVGISQLSAQSQKPAGLNSGEALRVYSNIETKRFVDAGRRWEAAHIDVARHHVRLLREMAAEDPALELSWNDKSTMRRIKWSEVELDDDSLVLKCEPSSSLPSDPGGKIEHVMNLANAGWIDPDRAMRLLELPELGEDADLRNAPYDYVREDLNTILTTGEPVEPDPIQNIQLSIATAERVYLLARLQHAPEERLDLVRQYMDKLSARLPPPPPPPGMGGGPADVSMGGPPPGAPDMPPPPPLG